MYRFGEFSWTVILYQTTTRTDEGEQNKRYATMHKGYQARKGKITKKSQQKNKTHPNVTKKIILQLEGENKALKKKLENEAPESRTQGGTKTEQENWQKIQELQAEIGHLIKQIE